MDRQRIVGSHCPRELPSKICGTLRDEFGPLAQALDIIGEPVPHRDRLGISSVCATDLWSGGVRSRQLGDFFDEGPEGGNQDLACNIAQAHGPCSIHDVIRRCEEVDVTPLVL